MFNLLRFKNILLSSVFILLIAISNALWGSTVGIAIFMDRFYNVDQSSLKGGLVNSVYYLFYLLFSPFCYFCGLMPALLSALLLTLSGVLVRINFYLPSPEMSDSGSNIISNIVVAFSGMNGVIVSNALIAAAQPFLFGFITTMTDECVPEKSRGIYIGLSSMFSSFGYAAGYLISIYVIHSSDDYARLFSSMNYVYLFMVIILILGMSIVLVSMYRLQKIQSANMEFSIQSRGQRILKLLSLSNKKQAQGSGAITNNQKYTYFYIFIYILIITLSYVVSNFLETMLQSKGFSDQEIMIASCLFLLPGIPFPLVFGYWMDKTKKWREIIGIVIVIQILTQTVFLYSNNFIVTCISLTINSITSTSLGSLFLTLISELCCPHSDKNCNNAMFSFSTFTTILTMIVPYGNTLSSMNLAFSLIGWFTIVLYFVSMWKKPVFERLKPLSV